jgi:hypothetical protein
VNKFALLRHITARQASVSTPSGRPRRWARPKHASLPHHFPGIAAYIFGGVRVTVPVALIMAFTMEMTAAGAGPGGVTNQPVGY